MFTVKLQFCDLKYKIYVKMIMWCLQLSYSSVMSRIRFKYGSR